MLRFEGEYSDGKFFKGKEVEKEKNMIIIIIENYDLKVNI